MTKAIIELTGYELAISIILTILWEYIKIVTGKRKKAQPIYQLGKSNGA